MEKCLKYVRQHRLPVLKKWAGSQVRHSAQFLGQIARSNVEDEDSVRFLTTYVKKHFVRFLFEKDISCKKKIWVMVACINFNWARFLYNLVK